MAKITMVSGKTFQANPSQSILEAAEGGGNSLPYSCRIGRCSSCRCRIEGPTSLRFEELGLTDCERESGWKLACARVPIGDVTLDIEDLGDLDLPKSKISPVRIDELKHLTADVLKVSLRLPPKTQFKFVPGQHISLIAANGLQRSYSLANYDNRNILEIHVRRIPCGIMSKYLFENAKVNDLLRISGPHGTFVLRSLAGNDIVFLATGTGIGSIKSMIEQMETLPVDHLPNSIKIIWGMRRENELYWSPSNKLNQVDFIPVLSKAGKSWVGERGYVQDCLFSSDVSPKTYIYACGSDAMISDARSRAIGAGLAEQHFYSDSFVASDRENL